MMADAFNFIGKLGGCLFLAVLIFFILWWARETWLPRRSPRKGKQTWGGL